MSRLEVGEGALPSGSGGAEATVGAVIRRPLLGLVVCLAVLAVACGSRAGSASDGTTFATADGSSFALDAIDGEAAVLFFWEPG